MTLTKGEVYFLSHGGPNSAFDTEAPPYGAWKKVGKAIMASQPRGLAFVSAHWENDSPGPGVIGTHHSHQNVLGRPA